MEKNIILFHYVKTGKIVQEGIAVHIITRGAIKLLPPSIGSERVAILLFPFFSLF